MDAAREKQTNTSENRSIPSLLSDLVNDLNRLFRQEILLAKTEMAEKVDQVTSGGISLAAGGAVVFAGFLVLLYSAVLGLAHVVAPWLSALIVGGVVVIIGALVLMKGRKDLKARNLAPKSTAASLRRDKEMTQRYASSS